jgi:FKBP-type peptidyl-prolyl cis-trans isomerase 2
MQFFRLFFFICALTLCSCAPSVVPTRLVGGERIHIDYTCRTPDGKLAATSIKDEAEDKSTGHSSIFKKQPHYLPADRTVPKPKSSPNISHTMSFEEMLEQLLARESLGAPLSQPLSLTISGELIPNIDGDDRYLALNRSYNQRREITTSRSKFEMIQKTAPVVGKQINTGKPGLTAVVTAVDGDAVTLKYSAEPEATSNSFFGPETISQDNEFLKIQTNPQLNTLLRSGDAIGKISKVNDKTYVIDYGHSFGFTPLTCDVVYRPFTSPDGLNWHHELQTAKEESSQTGTPLLILFHDLWNAPCRTFISEILPNPQVVKAMRGFVHARINAREFPELLQQYNVPDVPTILIFDNQGKLLQGFTGLPETDKLASTLLQFSKKQE